MLSKKCRYAIHALVYLASRTDDAPVQIHQIAEERRIPHKFLEAILLELKKARVLRSKRGKGGGYLLNRASSDINLMEVVRLMDGAIALLPCVSLNFYESCEECENEKRCAIRKTFAGVRDETLRILSECSLAQLVAMEKRKK